MRDNSDQFRSYLKLLARLHLGDDLRGKVDASDLAQETLLRAEHAKTQYRGTTTDEELAWLRRILARVVSNTRRNLRRQKRDLGREVALHRQIDGTSARLADLVAADQTSPSVRVERAERILKLSEVLDGLPDAQREAVTRHYLLGQPLAEIAAALDRSVPAVAGLLQRGLRALRERLNDSEASPHES